MKEFSRTETQRVRCSLITVGFSAVAIFIGQILTSVGAPQEAVVCIYLLCVVLTAATTVGYSYGIMSALICTVAYNFFVNAPVYSFQNFSPYLILTGSLMLIVALLISSITSKVKEGEVLARRREEETNVLYHLSKDLAGVTNLDAAIDITLTNVSQVFHTDCRILRFNEDGKPDQTFVLLENEEIYKHTPTNKNRTFEEYKTRPETGYYVNEAQYEWPMYASDGQVVASLAIPNETVLKLSQHDLKIINTMAETAGMAFEKLILARKQLTNQREVSQERYRTNLLRSISHDLRTPLAGISGTAEVLMEQLDEGTEAYTMASNIRKETVWLYNLVQNVLSLTRLQNSDFSIKAEVNIIEDVVDSAVETMKIRLPEREFITSYPEDVLVSKMDPSLIKQVIINLIDNANKYSPSTMPIEIVLREAEGQPDVAEILVRDFGEGLSQAALDKIFKMFYTPKAKTPGSMRGYGLGLPICDSIMKAHHGSITARNRKDGKKGSVFVLHLPIYDMHQTQPETEQKAAQ